MQTVIWKKNGMRLKTIEQFTDREGRARYAVCKETAQNPAMGRFSVGIDEVEAVRDPR